MSVKLRLSRMGRKKRPYYRIVAVDSRRKRDGAYIERLGYYHPLDQPATVNIEGERALKWLREGAIPSQTVLSLLKREGVWLRYRLERRGLPESQIFSIMAEWFAAHKKEAPPPEAPKPFEQPKQAESAAEPAEGTGEGEHKPEPEPAEYAGLTEPGAPMTSTPDGPTVER